MVPKVLNYRLSFKLCHENHNIRSQIGKVDRSIIKDNLLEVLSNRYKMKTVSVQKKGRQVKEKNVQNGDLSIRDGYGRFYQTQI